MLNVRYYKNFQKLFFSAIVLPVLFSSAPVFAASFAQRHSWVLDQLEPESAINNISATVHLRGLLTTSLLERSLNMFLHRHDVLGGITV